MPEQKQIQIKIPDDIMKGTYANMMQVSHTREEFVIDFMNVYPAQGAGVVGSRVVMSPGHLKRVITTLEQNLKKYEENFGKIDEASSPEESGVGFKAK